MTRITKRLAATLIMALLAGRIVMGSVRASEYLTQEPVIEWVQVGGVWLPIVTGTRPTAVIKSVKTFSEG